MREFITRVLRQKPRDGWRWLMWRWTDRKPLRRFWALKEYSWRKYNNARRKGRRRRAERWLERHKKVKAKFYAAKEQAEKDKAAAASGYDAGSHTSAWQGFRVAAWMRGDEPGPSGNKIDWLQKIADEGWNGALWSGWRSPEKSESLCFGICNAPSCPGLCAGRSSNHSQVGPPNWGAIDVQDWSDFQACNNNVHGPFKNNLPFDQPHRSWTGG